MFLSVGLVTPDKASKVGVLPPAILSRRQLDMRSSMVLMSLRNAVEFRRVEKIESPLSVSPASLPTFVHPVAGQLGDQRLELESL